MTFSQGGKNVVILKNYQTCIILQSYVEQAYGGQWKDHHWLIKHKTCHHIETSQLICLADQLTGFYKIETFALVS